MAPELAKQLLQIRQRNLLALADRRQGDGPVVLAQPQVNHRGNRKAAFGGETHHILLENQRWLTKQLKYSDKPSNLLKYTN